MLPETVIVGDVRAGGIGYWCWLFKGSTGFVILIAGIVASILTRLFVWVLLEVAFVLQADCTHLAAA